MTYVAHTAVTDSSDSSVTTSVIMCFELSDYSVPVWITSLAFIAANLGAQEVIGMCVSGAKYGILMDAIP